MNVTTVTLPSFAKINWNLRVLGKRADGYHDLVTVFQTVSLRDELRFTKRQDSVISLTCNELSLPTDKKNIVVRAADALRERFELDLGADIEIVKRIPWRAGLGGASSNAAVALLGLSIIWELSPTNALPAIAGGLGADVPFFLKGGRALGQGTGTVLSSLQDADKAHLIIISPNATVSTEFAYRALDASLTSINAIPILASSSAEPAFSDSDQWPLRNDFEAVIFDIEPEIERAKVALLKSGARGALLAGSGACVFGIFATDAARQTALERLQCEPGWRVFTCETISRDEYFREMGEFGSRLLRSVEKLSDIGA